MWPPAINWKLHECADRACRTLAELDGKLPRQSNRCERWAEVIRQCHLEMEAARASEKKGTELGDKVVRSLLLNGE